MGIPSEPQSLPLKVDYHPSRERYYGPSKGTIRELVFSGYLATSMMSDAERATLIMLLDRIRPKIAIEIGTAEAGSLSIIARYSERVYSLDVDPSCEARFSPHFPNTTFVVGDSRETMPALLDEVEDLEFVLIDGLHTASGVRADIENLLRFKPRRDVWIVMHDSFNPDCRQGMKRADWASSPFVHYVELDFVGGQYDRPECRRPKEMWCGLGLALMRPEPREGELTVSEDERSLYDAVLSLSSHRQGIFARVARRVRRIWRHANAPGHRRVEA